MGVTVFIMSQGLSLQTFFYDLKADSDETVLIGVGGIDSYFEGIQG